MRVKFGCCLIAFIVSLYSFSYAQTRPSAVHGNIFLQNNIAAEAATVILLNLPDSSVATSALVNSKGTFDLLNVKPGKYVLLATRLGSLRSFSNDFQLIAGQDFIIPPIILKESSNELKEVSIIAKTPFVETRPGKIIINPQASITADGKSVLDILKQSPGVRVDNGDNVSINGKQTALILIDGKTTNLTGTDLATLLRSLQGTTIDKIEIIKSASARYDAAAGGIVNIILKKGKNIGTNGNYTASIGYGRYYKANTGIIFNSRSEKLNIFGNYNIETKKTFRDIYTDRNITNAGIFSNYNSTYNNIQEALSHTFKIGADYYLNPEHIIGVVVNGVVSSNDFVKNNTLKITNQGSLDSVIKAASTIDRNLNYFNYNVNYSGRLDKDGKNLSASLTYSPNNRHNNEYITNQFYTALGSEYRNLLLLQNLSPSNRSNWTALIDYVNPLSKAGKLETGLKYSRTRSDNNFIFGPFISGQYTSDPNFSNRFIYTEAVAAAYVNYINSFGKFDLEAGLRGEHSNTEGNSVNLNLITTRKYFNMFPSLLLNYRYNDKNQFNLTFSRGIKRPEYEKLNPFFAFLDLYSYQSGNSNLKPSYINSIILGHTYNESVSSTLYANFSTNSVFPFYTQDNVTKVTVLSQRNLGKVNSYGTTLSIPIKIFSWWTSSYDIDASYQLYIAYPQNGNLHQGIFDFISKATQNFIVSKTITAEIRGGYESAVLYGVNRFRPQYSIDAGVRAQILNKKGSIGINVSDVFNTLRDRYYTYYQGLDLRQTDKSESRIFRLNFTYRFGKTTIKAAPTRRAGNEEEQSRMRKGN
ncbi:outer membrane beta-barrel protein [Mucilaginibacter sp.]|jgi:outer membrane receptor protein involved in Fe transport|uniref:outer membrane beta-barrel protein n=1 Tax=Mucilaginibacter sp. TaxID=1882438 RepID=UPI003566E189